MSYRVGLSSHHFNTHFCPIGTALANGLSAGDHIGVFAPQSRFVVESFSVAANIDLSKLDQPYDAAGGLGGGPGGTCSLSEPTSSVTLRQVLTWQVQLSGLAPLTAIKVRCISECLLPS